ncbi:DUF998 domain-containing protein [Streptomyces sp. NPDC055189]
MANMDKTVHTASVLEGGVASAGSVASVGSAASVGSVASRTGARPLGAVALLLALGAVAYSAWLLEAFIGTALSPVSSYVSELAALDQPYGTLFRSTDLTAGLLILAGAAGALLWLPRRRVTVVGWAALALYGAATAVDSRLPMSCAPTADALCEARERAGLVPLSHAAHVVSSSVAVTGALVAMAALTLAARRHAVLPSLAGAPGRLLVLLELAATIWTLAAIGAFDAGYGTWALGLGQRFQVLLIAAWLGLLASAVVRRR